MQGVSLVNELDPLSGTYPPYRPLGGQLNQQNTLQETLQNLPCNTLTGLSKGQAQLCVLYKDHIPHIGRGARQGINECQFQFKTRRWNCSTTDDQTVFGPILGTGMST